jgi:hypothetical protein
MRLRRISAQSATKCDNVSSCPSFHKIKAGLDRGAGEKTTCDSDRMRTHAVSLALGYFYRFGTEFDHKVRSYHTFE